MFSVLFFVAAHILHAIHRPLALAIDPFLMPVAALPFSLAGGASLTGDWISLLVLLGIIALWSLDLHPAVPILVSAGIGAILGTLIRRVFLERTTNAG